MEVGFDSIADWEFNELLAVEADPLVEMALDVVHRLNREQQLALLDRLGIDYSQHLQADEPEPVIEQPKPVTFADLF